MRPFISTQMFCAQKSLRSVYPQRYGSPFPPVNTKNPNSFLNLKCNHFKWPHLEKKWNFFLVELICAVFCCCFSSNKGCYHYNEKSSKRSKRLLTLCDLCFLFRCLLSHVSSFQLLHPYSTFLRSCIYIFAFLSIFNVFSCVLCFFDHLAVVCKSDHEASLMCFKFFTPVISSKLTKGFNDVSYVKILILASTTVMGTFFAWILNCNNSNSSININLV